MLISYNPREIHWSLGGMHSITWKLRYQSLYLKGKHWALVAPSKGHHFITPAICLMHSVQHVNCCLSGKFWLSLWNVVLQMFESLRMMSAQQVGIPFWSSMPSAGVGSLLVLAWLIAPNGNEPCPGGGKEIPVLGQVLPLFSFSKLPTGSRALTLLGWGE